MTVREFLAGLQHLPRDAEVLAFEAGCEEYCEREVDEVEVQGGRVYLHLGARRRQPRRFNDGEEAEAAAGPQKPFAGSQHGELGAQSTQHVGVDDGVEAAGSEGESAGRGGHDAYAGSEPFGRGAVGGHA